MVEELNETMAMSDELKDMDELEDKINKLAKKIESKGKDEDQVEPLTIDRKLHMMSLLFPIELGNKVKNKLGEEGVVEMVGIDHRGVLYLTQYKDQNSRWEAEAQIEKIVQPGANGEVRMEIPTKSVRTDVPDPKTQIKKEK